MRWVNARHCFCCIFHRRTHVTALHQGENTKHFQKASSPTVPLAPHEKTPPRYVRTPAHISRRQALHGSDTP